MSLHLHRKLYKHLFYTRYLGVTYIKVKFIMAEFKEYSAVEIIQLLGTQFREYRLRLNMTQKDVSERSGISILTINKFENGTIGKMSFATFIALIKAIGYIDNLEYLLPALPESPYLYNDTKKVQRVRHKRK